MNTLTHGRAKELGSIDLEAIEVPMVNCGISDHIWSEIRGDDAIYISTRLGKWPISLLYPSRINSEVFDALVIAFCYVSIYTDANEINEVYGLSAMHSGCFSSW